MDRAELIEWQDALDVLVLSGDLALARGIRLVRQCQHPDAQWLASLFPGDEDVAQEHMWEVLRKLNDDPRAMFVAWRVGTAEEDDWDDGLLDRSAERGYAPAQAAVARACLNDVWAQFAAAQQERSALYMLGKCCREARLRPRSWQGH
jgi:hypothetical protein